MTQSQNPSGHATRFCSNCGTGLAPQALFCNKCGTAVPETRTSGESPTQPDFRTAGPPPQQTPNPSIRDTPVPHVPNYLVQAIFVTLCCCTPLGVVSIVFAAQVNGKLANGDYFGAVGSSNKARTWAITGLVLGLVTNILWGLGYAIWALGILDV